MERDGELFKGEIPGQPAAGKVEYSILLIVNNKKTLQTEIHIKNPFPHSEGKGFFGCGGKLSRIGMHCPDMG